MTDQQATPILIDALETEVSRPDFEVSDMLLEIIQALTNRLLSFQWNRQYDQMEFTLDSLSPDSLRFIISELLYQVNHSGCER